MKIITGILFFSFVFMAELSCKNEDSLLLELQKAGHDTTRISLCLQLGDAYRAGNIDTAYYFYHRAFQMADKGMKTDAALREKYLFYQASAIRSKGLVYYLKQDNDKALDYFQNALKLFKGLQDSRNKEMAAEGKKGMAKCYGNFGAVYKDRADYPAALEYIDKAIKMASEVSDKKTMSVAFNNKGIIYYYTGDFEESVKNYEMASRYFEETGDLRSMAAALTNIGLVYTAQGYYVKSVESYQQSLKVLEKLDDQNGISSCYNNIGIVYYEQRSYEKALEYYEKALKIYRKTGNKYIAASIYNNIGNVYSDISQFDKSLENYFQALSLREELQDKLSIAGLYNNIGLVYFYKKDYALAMQYYEKCYGISNEIGDRSSMAKVLGNLSALYVRLSEKENGDRQYYLKKAIEAGNKSFKLALDIGAVPVQNTTAGQLQKAYTSIGDYKQALYYAEAVINTKDSMFSDEKMQVMAEVNARYETERRELQIENLNKENKLQQVLLENSEAQRSRQKMLLYVFVSGLFVVLVFSIVLYRLFLQKKKANLLLALQKQQIESKNSLLEQANEEINSQKDEIETQRDMVMQQKTYIEEQQKSIVDSINYARRIQFAVIPTGKRAESLLGESHFVFFRPRDVVSGDFYWVSRVKNYLVVAVADCTGHGVPGAFMSMMGISLLNEIVRKDEVKNAGDMVSHLRNLLVESLNQESNTKDQDIHQTQNYQFARDITTASDLIVKDGMDISLVVINTSTLHCQWAGAYNPLFIIRKTNITESAAFSRSDIMKKNHADIVEELKPDKMPVGLHFRMGEFTNHEFDLTPGDRLYLFTDGYHDQFGGDNGKKMGLKVFRNILAATSSLPIREQGSQLATWYDAWVNMNGTSYNQIDDVTVLGLEV
jgi:tetratricopeptide (TPR) repeat protein